MAAIVACVGLDWGDERYSVHLQTADGTVHPTELRVIDSIRTVLDLPPGVPERYPACVFWRRLR